MGSCETQALEHQDMVPVYGTVLRCYNHFFANAGPAAIMKFPTVVQAQSNEALPVKGCYETMDGAVFRLAWLLGYSKSLGDPAELAKYRSAALSIPVIFEAVSDCIIKKIQLDQDKKATEEFAGLIGYKLTRIAVQAQEELKKKNKPCGQEQVYAYLKKEVDWTKADAVSLKSVQMAIKVHSRLSSHACNILDQFESIYSKDFPFCLVQGLDAVCQKTAVPSNPGLATRRVYFVVAQGHSSLRTCPCNKGSSSLLLEVPGIRAGSHVRATAPGPP